MQHRRHLVILNPTAGMGLAGRRRAEIEAALDAAGLDCELVLTERRGHAVELAEGAAGRGFAVAVAAGGDGTANEVLNGLARAARSGRPAASMGLLPVGRGNDFAFGAAIPAELGAAVAALAEGAEEPFDIGLVAGGDYPEGRYFGNGLGIGFDTIVGLEAARMKRVHGFMAYVFGALRTLLIYPKAPELRLSYDGLLVEGKSHQISIMNGKRMGGTFFMAPRASDTDGRLELCMAGELGRLDMLRLIAKYVKGSQAADPGIRSASSSSYIVEAPEGGLVCHADGETICVDGKRLEARCLPGLLRIVRRPGSSAPEAVGAPGFDLAPAEGQRG